MPRDRLLVYHYPTNLTLLLCECPLLAIRGFRAVPLSILGDALPGHLLVAVFADTPGLERGLRRPVSAFPALMWVVVFMLVIIASNLATLVRLRSFHLYTWCFKTF